ncbi:MAG: hypothetical protein LC623_05505 [Halobacteriales archaeon]|nr:hypothetical protein [Halobacteriales archaeon]
MSFEVRLPKSLRKGYRAKEKRDRILLAVSLEAERRAKLKAPVNHGRLRSSIEGGVDDQGGFVRAQTTYAAFNEFGTMSRGAQTDPGPTPSWYQHSGRPGGLEATPFLRPAVQSMRGADIADIARSNSQD